jgi:hypothetical protein
METRVATGFLSAWTTPGLVRSPSEAFAAQSQQAFCSFPSPGGLQASENAGPTLLVS